MSVGKLEPFSREKNWSTYISRLNQYFKANAVTEDLKTAILITAVGDETFELMVDLCSPKKPEDYKYDNLVQVVKDHLQPTPSEIAERYIFRQRKQNEGESFSTYVAALKKLAKSCNYGTILEEQLRDQLVFGLRNDNIRQHLFAEKNLTYKKAYELAINLEAAEKNSGLIEPAAVKKLSSYHKPGKSQSAKDFNKRFNKDKNITIPSACIHCGKNNHESNQCYFKNALCHKCEAKGHISAICKKQHSKLFTKNKKNYKFTKYVAGVQDNNSDSDDLDFYNISSIKDKPIKVKLCVNNKLLCMECDTGSPVSVISENFYLNNFSDVVLHNCTMNLKSYAGDVLDTVGFIYVTVAYKKLTKKLKLVVVKNGGPPLFGREWITDLHISVDDLLRVNTLAQTDNIDYDILNVSDVLKNKFPDVFKAGLGKFNKTKAKLYLKEDAIPVFCRPRNIPMALKEKVEKELDNLVKNNILTPVQFSDWATPIVPVLKKHCDEVRICGDFKITLNPMLHVDTYPIPKIDNLFAVLKAGKYFSKIDLSQAYAQVELEEESKKLTTLNTHKGLFQMNRLPYGVSSSPGIFQRLIEQVFAGMNNVVTFLDDILITGSSKEHHMENLMLVFNKLQDCGLRVKLSKCLFFQNKINFLGHCIDKEGLHTAEDKVKAILEAPTPENITQLKSFLGLVNFYGKFIENLSHKLHYLHILLRKNVKWFWGSKQKDAFVAIKKELASPKVLIHYDPTLPIILASDASAYAVGGVISHILPNGDIRPIAYASRSLSDSEKLYSQLDREGLAIIFCLKKFHDYLYARFFTLLCDHKALINIFGEKKGIPQYAASRLQRWSIILSTYNYEIKYVKSENNYADALSRLPLTNKTELEPDFAHILYVSENLPIDYKKIAQYTRNDPILNKVRGYCLHGWPENKIEEQYKVFYNKKDQLHLEQGCILWGFRIIIPKKLQLKILEQIHLTHMGISKCKAMARSYIWWPNIDSDIEHMCKTCKICNTIQSNPQKTVLHPWPFENTPWSRVHVDFMGPIFGHMYFILIDSFSKWPEVLKIKSTDAKNVIRLLKSLFSRFGLPTKMVSDNGPPFTSQEFENFLKVNGIRHLFSTPYHPSSNGQAENTVKTFKIAIKKALLDNKNSDSFLEDFLFDYRNCPHSTTGVSPAMKMFNRNLRNRLDLLRPNFQDYEKNKTELSIAHYGGKPKSFEVGEQVLIKDYSNPRHPSWRQGEITDREGSVIFDVKTQDGKECRRHSDQIQPLRKSGKFIRSETLPENAENKDSIIPDNDLTEVVDSNQIPGATENTDKVSSSRYNLRSRP